MKRKPFIFRKSGKAIIYILIRRGRGEYVYTNEVKI